MPIISALSKMTPKKAKVQNPKPTSVAKPPLSTEFVQDSDDEQDQLDTGRLSNWDKRDSPASKVQRTTKPATITPSHVSKKRKTSPSGLESEGSSKEGTVIEQNNNKTSNGRRSGPSSKRPSSPGKSTLAHTRADSKEPSPRRSSNGKIVTKQRRSSSASTHKSSSAFDDGSEESASGSDETDYSEESQASSIPPYEPPEGFEAATIAHTPSSQVGEIFMPENLGGKQVWHITTPASVPIESVKHVSAQSIQDGSSILSYKGAEYGLVSGIADESAHSRGLLLPCSERNSYRPANVSISNTLHLQQLVGLPTLTSTSDTPLNGSMYGLERSTKPRNEQPPRLKMRYHAFGIPSDSEPEVVSETATERPQIRHPNIPNTTPMSKPKKRKRTFSDNHSPSDQAPAKKSKREKSQAEAIIDNETEEVEAMDVDSLPQEKFSQNEALLEAQSVPQNRGATQNAEQPNGKESKEDRAKRKAEKKRLKVTQAETKTQIRPPPILPAPILPEPIEPAPEERNSNGTGSKEDRAKRHAEQMGLEMSQTDTNPAPSSQTKDMNGADDEYINGDASETRGREQDPRHPAVADAADRAETKEERRRRKEEKKKRKGRKEKEARAV